ncbi:alpha/beta hydrolase [Indioceanicola profundi]|uniref:alpha/beta hydrolase n=1 Tax=Indioceanicola profundi TaxID=2220096 RepID=UPI000E6ADB30|nr:alpha/beta hydrolase [Indioceanicola profundi]
MRRPVRRLLPVLLLLLSGLAAPVAARAETEEVWPLWPAEPPGGELVTVVQEVLDRPAPPGLRDRAVTGIRAPTLTVFRPARPTGAAMLLIPGGGYARVVVDKEGLETARWLADRGIAAYVLLYRLPADGWAAGADAPLQDAQRAMRLIRSHAAAEGVSPDRVGVMGFSAGGHLAARLAAEADREIYAPVDGADSLSARPTLAALIYPVIAMDGAAVHAGSRTHLLGSSPSLAEMAALSAQNRVTSQTPPTFLLHAMDDTAVPPENALIMVQALRAAGVPVEAHLFEEGGHGFGLRAIAGKPVAAWPDLFLTWAMRKGLSGADSP